MKPLPPLNSLVVFEAAARHLSFTLAADELCVTQGAVSRQVRRLEDFLGCDLFIRKNRSLTLTQQGLEYYKTIQPVLLQVAGATANLVGWSGDDQITVMATSALANYWLIPKYRGFQEKYPQIKSRILAVESYDQVHASEFDVAVFYFDEPPADVDATPLFRESVFPVCSPAYLDNYPHIAEADNLVDATLLMHESRAGWISWEEWLADCGLRLPTQSTRTININSYPLVIQAALSGQGLALGWETLIHEYLKSGLLVKPVDTSLLIRAQAYIIEPRSRYQAKVGTSLFRNWLLAQ